MVKDVCRHEKRLRLFLGIISRPPYSDRKFKHAISGGFGGLGVWGFGGLGVWGFGGLVVWCTLANKHVSAGEVRCCGAVAWVRGGSETELLELCNDSSLTVSKGLTTGLSSRKNFIYLQHHAEP